MGGRQLKEVRIWMLRNNVRPEDIKDALGLADTSAVTHFLNGDMTSRPIMAFLIGRGCPKLYFNEGRVAA